MVQQTELIQLFRKSFTYKEGKLFWATGRRLVGKEAGHKSRDGYIQVRIDGISFLAHRIIFAIHHGYLPDLIDHRDRNSMNNLVENLREANKKINAINTNLPINNTTGIKGVTLYKGKYDAYLHTIVNGRKKKINLGRFNTIEDATTARQTAERTYWTNL